MCTCASLLPRPGDARGSLAGLASRAARVQGERATYVAAGFASTARFASLRVTRAQGRLPREANPQIPDTGPDLEVLRPGRLAVATRDFKVFRRKCRRNPRETATFVLSVPSDGGRGIRSGSRIGSQGRLSTRSPGKSLGQGARQRPREHRPFGRRGNGRPVRVGQLAGPQGGAKALRLAGAQKAPSPRERTNFRAWTRSRRLAT